MPVKKPSIVVRLLRFVLFILFPMLLMAGAIALSYGAVQAVARRVSEQAQADQRAGLYAATLTRILPTLTTFTPEPTATLTPSSTFTVTPSTTPSATFTNTYTATPSATATLSPAPSATLTPTPQPTLVAQAFMTNTPRPLDVTLPALNTDVPAATNTVPPTATTTLTPTAPDTATAVAVETSTPRPLPTLLFPNAPDTSLVAPTAIPTQVPTIDRQGYDLVNILLLGGDSELTADGIDRTDTMIVVSINRTTNTVSMLSLPRDLFVFIPGWTMQRLNLTYIRGEQVGWTDGGFGLMRQTIFYNLGINVHYYIKVDLSGFKEIIDTLGGVDLTVDCAIQDQELISAPPPPESLGPDDDGYYILPVGFYHFDGGSALWYARSRHSSSDFDRGRRQQQLLRAIWRAARGSGQITKLPQLWSELTGVVETNLAFEDMVGLLPFALNLDPDRIEHFTMKRLYHTTPWQPPDGSNVQLPNYDPVRQLMEDFYQPPTENQVNVEGARVEVYNGTTNPNWDRIAADRLGWDGLSAIASGSADTDQYADTVLIDRSGQTKGSRLDDIVKLLNVKPENILVEPDPNRTADYEVIIGSNYNSCTEAGVLPVETPEG